MAERLGFPPTLVNTFGNTLCSLLLIYLFQIATARNVRKQLQEKNQELQKEEMLKNNNTLSKVAYYRLGQRLLSLRNSSLDEEALRVYLVSLKIQFNLSKK